MMRKEPAWFEVGLTNCDSLSFVPRLCGSATTHHFLHICRRPEGRQFATSRRHALAEEAGQVEIQIESPYYPYRRIQHNSFISPIYPHIPAVQSLPRSKKALAP